MDALLEKLTTKKKTLDQYRPFPVALAANLWEWYRVELTYTSNAIEGNTLSRQETALVVEKGLTVQGKTLKEHLEAVNHVQALQHIQKLASKKSAPVTEQDILEIHRIILQKIDDSNAGRYRSVPVRVAGSTVIFPNAVKVPLLMKHLDERLHLFHKEHPVKIAAEAHLKLVTIHPFVDGNGRTARLLMNLILMGAGYPPAVIKKEDRLGYINAIEKAQIYDDTADYCQLIYRAVGSSLDAYIDALKSKTPKTKNPDGTFPRLLKIGQLAKASGETVHTLRYWTSEELLTVKDHSPGGYQLYDSSMIERIKTIRRLQREKRLSITEIKNIR